MVDYNAALPQLQQFQAPNMLAMAAQANQMQLYQAQLAKAQNDAEMQSKLRSLDRNSPEFVNQLYAMDPAKGLAYDKGLLDFAEAKRKRGEAASDRATTAKKEAELEKIYGGFNNLAPAAAAAPAEAPIPQMGFGGDAGKYTSVPAPAAATVAPMPGGINYAGMMTELIKGGHIAEAVHMQNLAKSHTETRGKEYENSVKQIDAAYAPLQALTNRVQSPADVAAYTQMLYNDPVLGPQAAKIKPLDQAIADSQREFAANPQQWQLAHSKVDGKVIYDAATNSVAPKIVAKDVGGSIKYIDENPKSPTFMKEVGDFAKTPSPAEITRASSANVPKPKPGEVWNPELERMDAVKGSDLYISQIKKHEKDAKGLQGVERKTEEAIKTMDEILAPENTKAFEQNFGGYGAYATRLQSGDVAKIRNKLTTMASNLKAAGLEEFRTGGSIGAMTEKEWPIVEKQIASLSPDMSDTDARAVIRDVMRRLSRVRDDERELYKDTWENTQYYKKPKEMPVGNDLDSNNPLLK